MPFPNEHAIRLKDSNMEKIRVRRTKGSCDALVNGVKIPSNISVIWFVANSDGKEVPIPQSLRFPIKNWSHDKVKEWKSTNKIDGTLEEAGNEDTAGTITVFRTDRISQKVGQIKRTDEGYLSGIAPIAKVGIMTYFLNDGSIRREYVPKETLFAQESMDSLKMKPITDSHPAERAVNPQNANKRKVGFTGETVKSDGDFLTTSLTVTDESAINNVDKGRQELSPGYRCDILLQSGNHDGSPYDAIQTKRSYNHVALCDSARGGSDVRLHLDSESAGEIDGFELEEIRIDNLDDDTNNNLNSKRSRFMSTLKLDGIDYNADQQVINHIDKVTSKNADSISKLDKLQAKLDSANAKIDEFGKRNIDEEVKESVKSRIDLERQASDHLDKETVKVIDSISDSEIRSFVILKAFPKANLDNKSDDYISARYDSALELLIDKVKQDKEDKSKNNMFRQRQQANQDNTDNSDAPDQDKSRNDMIERLKNGGNPVKKDK